MQHSFRLEVGLFTQTNKIFGSFPSEFGRINIISVKCDTFYILFLLNVIHFNIVYATLVQIGVSINLWGSLYKYMSFCVLKCEGKWQIDYKSSIE